MTFRRELFLGLTIVFAISVFMSLIVVRLTPQREEQQSRTETNFRETCAEVNGRAVWNGRNWECLK